MDVEKLSEVGKGLGLGGKELLDFIAEQKKEMERLAREELELRRQDKELFEMQLQLESMKKENLDTLEHSHPSEETHEAGARPKIRAPKLPVFDDNDNLDAYLQRYERYATAQGWSKKDWGINLSALLKGKALEVYSRLPVLNDANEYEKA
ncbi:hypothetical protein HOLleu_44761 [Holothuria leucospilota]|uniref:Uncharacterized protein n=1 Tax=Holothuria leucospilota TaxID=206669 RepID=A0A9Q0Y9E4_HOLLE|nr:hypothetical protein HOLleu_44761 [Holothuria leucospilota]